MSKWKSYEEFIQNWSDFKKTLRKFTMIGVHNLDELNLQDNAIQETTYKGKGDKLCHIECCIDETTGTDITADGQIVRKSNIDDYMQMVYDGKRELIQYNIKGLDIKYYPQMTAEAYRQINTEYDKKQIQGFELQTVYNWFAGIFKWKKMTKNPEGDDKKLICSESVVKLCRSAKDSDNKIVYNVCAYFDIQDIAPTDITYDPLIERTNFIRA
jgi:hypothetical protein